MRSKVKGSGPPCSLMNTLAELAPSRGGASTLEPGQASVEAPLLPSHVPPFSCGCQQLLAVAPTPALTARGLSNRGKNDLMRVGAGAGGPCNQGSAVGPARASRPFLLPAPPSGSAWGSEGDRQVTGEVLLQVLGPRVLGFCSWVFAPHICSWVQVKRPPRILSLK